MNVFPHIKDLIKSNQQSILKQINAIKKEQDLKRRCVMACRATTFAMRNNSDIFVSDVLEAPFLELADKIDVPLKKSYTPGTVLHIATEVYPSGGHTRCIERWIQLMAKQKHSCYLLSHCGCVPEILSEQVKNSGGDLVIANKKDSMVKRAKELRTYASGYEYIVLHIHMDDPICLIAFGTEQFPRPIIYFNHADHIFWFGASIADYVADLSEVRHEITKHGRNIARAYMLGIPTEQQKVVTPQPLISDNKMQIARSQLQLPQNAKIIFSSGDSHKYAPIGTPDFADIITKIAKTDTDILFCLAGPQPQQTLWKRLSPEILRRIRFTGYLDYATEYPLYLNAADIILDSYPVNGSTSAIDAIEAGKIIIALEAPFIQDFLAKSEGACKTLQELVTKVTQILHNPEYGIKLYENIHASWQEHVDSKKWIQRCETLYTMLPKKHSVHKINEPELPTEISPISTVTAMWTRRPLNLWKRIRRWMLHYDKKIKEWCIFGYLIPTKKYANNIYRNDELNSD